MNKPKEYRATSSRFKMPMINTQDVCPSVLQMRVVYRFARFDNRGSHMMLLQCFPRQLVHYTNYKRITQSGVNDFLYGAADEPIALYVDNLL
jgi:hypothetical protein